MNLTERGESFDVKKINNYNVIATSNELNQSSRESKVPSYNRCIVYFKHGVMHDKPKFAIAQCSTYLRMPFHGIFTKSLLEYFYFSIFFYVRN